MNKAIKRMALGLLATALLAGCEPVPKDPPPRAETGQRIRGNVDSYDINPYFFTHGDQVFQELLDRALKLRQATLAFLEQSDEHHWQILKEQWLSCHQQWHKSSFYLASGQQYPASLPALTSAMRWLHATPITPGFLDGIPDYPKGGIVFDTTVVIEAKSIRSQHQHFSKEEVATGLHAMEFFLWGKQLSDYNQGRAITQEEIFRGLEQEQLPTPRRRAYLALLSGLIVEDIRKLKHDWSSSANRLNRLQPKQKRQLATGNGIRQLSTLIDQLKDNHSAFNQDLNWQVAQLVGIEESINHEDFSLTTAIELIEAIRNNPDDVARAIQRDQLSQQLSQAIEQLKAIKPSAQEPK